VLTCGRPKYERIDEKRILDYMLPRHKDYVLPYRDPKYWTIRALYMHMRVVGTEIIVPEQRVYHVKSTNNDGVGDDVIIAQYVTTKVGKHGASRLEIRQEELYPAVFYNFTAEDIELGATCPQP
jgi:hypothetical protein